MRKIAVVGFGQTKFGELWDKSLRDLAAEAGALALKDSTLDAKRIEALYVGSMAPGRFAGQEHLAAMAADQLGLNPIPATRTEAACASGATAFREAVNAVASGKHNIVMALGAEKMTDLKTSEATTALMGAGDQEWEAGIGLTFPGLYALMARAHMAKYGTTSQQLSTVSVINHRHGAKNKKAQYPFEITLEQVMRSPMVADPLRLLDCSPITDGAAAVIVASEDVAKKLNPAWVLSVQQASDSVALHDRASFTEINAACVAAKKAYEEAKLSAKGIDVAEVHDCFSINEILAVEALGFCPAGKGGEFVEANAVAVGGEKPTNTTGGLKSIGHPVGATGIRQIGDIYLQLTGRSCNQVKGAKRGIALNVGGSGATANVTILGGNV
ncbi:MAG: thiolase domain-containing protein [Candidatus Aenigmarchaeota archaeon]|nr:thiolase domain-containing protein [Candidatus Aenigmarchaeota archaeon]